MKYFMIAGERSGDMYGSHLVSSLREKDPEAEIEVYGGDQMQLAGARLLHHYKSIAYMGFLEVVTHLAVIRRVLKQCKRHLVNLNPDVLILIDYPGFNLRMARFAARRNIKVVYYISPKLWAWRSSRIKIIRRCVDKMLVIFPFEVKFYERLNYEVKYVGNPLITEIKIRSPKELKIPGGYQQLIAFYPGSRHQELQHSLPLLHKLSRHHENWLFIVAAVDNVSVDMYDHLTELKNVQVHFDANYDILLLADAAVITSGTATLECALCGVPQVVGYKTSWISYQIGRAVIRLPYISLVNILAGKEVVLELIQDYFTMENVSAELDRLLSGQKHRDQMSEDYKSIRTQLGEENAAENAADEILNLLGGN